MAKFEAGDKVLVNGTQVATVKVYDEQSGQVVLVQPLGGNATNEIYLPINAPGWHLEHLVSGPVGSETRPGDEPEAGETTDEPEAPEGDQFTTSSNFI